MCKQSTLLGVRLQAMRATLCDARYILERHIQFGFIDYFPAMDVTLSAHYGEYLLGLGGFTQKMSPSIRDPRQDTASV